MSQIDTSPPPSAKKDLEEKIVQNFFDILTSPHANPADLPEELLCVPKVQEMHNMLWGIRNMAYSLSMGQLDYACRERGFIIGALKAFQSNLRHLTWQAQRIASGEYNHRVDFLGEFSVAFNQMAEQLSTKIDRLTTISEEYKDQSLRDPLTGLLNRNGILNYFEQRLANNAGSQNISTLIMADLDKFKNINDTYGHQCGDEVLRQFSAKLLVTLRPNDVCCRYGGEEFMLFLPDTPLHAGVFIAERLRKAIEDTNILFDNKKIKITASFGLSELKDIQAGQNTEGYIDTSLKTADTNLYKAKANGRNQVVA